MKYIKIVGFSIFIFLLSSCNDDNGPFTIIDEPSAERLEQLAYYYGKWEIINNNFVYQNNIVTDSFRQHYYLDFQADGYAPQTRIDLGLQENYYWNLSQDATEMVICIDINPINGDESLGCTTYQIMEQTDSTQFWQIAYYGIQGTDSTLYVNNWNLIRQ